MCVCVCVCVSGGVVGWGANNEFESKSKEEVVAQSVILCWNLFQTVEEIIPVKITGLWADNWTQP